MANKIIALAEIDLNKINKNVNEVSFIRGIHREVPRKLVVNSILDTAIKEEENKAYCTLELKQAPMISIDELKSYATQHGERTSVKRLIKWLENLK